MPANYVISRVAENDIEEIVTYIASDNIVAAEKFIDTLYDSFEMLSESPLIGHLREDITHHPVRFWTFKWHYLVVYLPEEPTKIVRVLSGYRDIANLL